MTNEHYTREKQIADELKQEMAALNRRIARLNEWKESGYEEPCQEHDWTLEDFVEHPPVVRAHPFTYTARYKCHRCGMTMERKATVTKETLFDEWQEYRENKGDEEE